MTTPQSAIASSAACRAVSPPAAEIVAQLDDWAATASLEGLQVSGLDLAKALCDKPTINRLKKLVFGKDALALIRRRATRVEFISEGPLPPELLLEPASKGEAIYTQIVDYALCKGCRLCIQVCPKHVYKDDGFGKPDTHRREEECTGNAQCGQCVYICPERAISMQMLSPTHESTVFVVLPNPYAVAEEKIIRVTDFALANPLEVGAPTHVDPAIAGADLAEACRRLEDAGILPLLDIGGRTLHWVDAADPEADLAVWARENGRSPRLVRRAVAALQAALPTLTGLRQGKLDFGTLIHRVIDEVLHAEIEPGSAGAATLIGGLIAETRIVESVLGARDRPIGGLLPPATSVAWKTPYGNEVPNYTHVEKCLGPECGLCVTHCPEGNGGEQSAIRLVPKVPMATIPALVRGLRAWLLRADGSHAGAAEMEDLSGREAFSFEVDTDYCKACGLCISCCPHDVIEPAARNFDMGAAK